MSYQGAAKIPWHRFIQSKIWITTVYLLHLLARALKPLYIINAHTIHLLVLANIQWHVTSLHSGKVHKDLQQGVVKLKLNHLKI